MDKAMILEIVSLRDVKKFTWNQIADKLNITVGKAQYWYNKFYKEDSEELRVEEEANKIITKLEDKINKLDVKSSAIAKIISDYLKEYITEYDESNFGITIIPIEGNENDVEIVVHITDWHLGKKSKTYHKEIAIQSLNKIFLAIKEEAEILEFKGNNLIGIKILLGGDLVDGDLLYPGHPNFVDINVYEQIAIGSNILRDMIINIHQNIVSKVDIYHVYGNHGRVSKFTNPKNNWDNLLYMMLKTSIQNIPGISFCGEGTNWYELIPTLNGENILLFHGDGIRMYQNIPMYGYVQRVMRFRGSIGDFKYSMIGHFHSPYSMVWSDMKLFINGQFPTDDDWALKMIGLQSPPEQTLHVFSKNRLEYSKPIYLL